VGRTDLEDALGRLDRLTQDEVRMAAAQGLKAIHEVDNKVQKVDNRLQQVVDEIGDEKRLSSNASPHSSSTLTTHTGNQLRKDLGNWLSPPDPSINYNTASDVHHEGTSLWFMESSAFNDWKASGSLMWIHGKRMVISNLSCRLANAFVCIAGSGKSVLRFVTPPPSHAVLGRLLTIH
jgi:hypothetical protein